MQLTEKYLKQWQKLKNIMGTALFGKKLVVQYPYRDYSVYKKTKLVQKDFLKLSAKHWVDLLLFPVFF